MGNVRLRVYNNSFNEFSLNYVLFVIFSVWLFEWFFVIEYCFNIWSYTRLIYPYRTSVFLLICFIYWIYVWGVSVWRRTQFGKFTRGDRKLWFKGFSSFWIVEITTILGIYIAACWMSWGPAPLMPRYFLMPKKGFFVELTFFTYSMWLIYFIRFSLKWNLWKTQYILVLLTILVLVNLIWRDFLTLFMRDLIDMNVGSRWKYMTINQTLYSFNPEWWLHHHIGNHYHYESLFDSMEKVVDSNFQINPFYDIKMLKEYDRFHWMPYMSYTEWLTYAVPCYYFLNFKDLSKILRNDLNVYSVLLNDVIILGTSDLFYDSYKFYPRRIGFVPKKLAMWTFLVVLKIWHHFMLFLLWFIYLIRLYSRKKGSYSLLSACYFNLYCCFLIGLAVYLFHLLPLYEGFFRIKPKVRSMFHNRSILVDGIMYVFNFPSLETSSLGLKRIHEQLFYSFSENFGLAVKNRLANLQLNIVTFYTNLKVWLWVLIN